MDKSYKYTANKYGLELTPSLINMKRFRQMLAPFYLHALFLVPMFHSPHKTHWHIRLEIISQIISFVILGRMLSKHLKKQHALMNHGLRILKQFALTKMYIAHYHVHP